MRHRVAFMLALAGLCVPRLSAQTRAGGEFRVNTYTASAQSGGSVAYDGRGNFVVTWMSLDQDGSGEGVFGQRFDASGASVGSEFQVNAYTTGSQSGLVACDVAGRFVVAWSDPGRDGGGWGVFAQRYDASGTRRGAEFQVNSFTGESQLVASQALDAAGNFVVVWQSDGQDGYGWGVFAQRYDASGAPRGSELQVNTYTSLAQLSPVVASDAAGNFVVAWTSAWEDGSEYGVFAQRYDTSGNRVGGEFQVNTQTLGRQSQPSVASDPAGNFVVVWTGGLGGTYGILAQRYDASGTPRGSELRVDGHVAARTWSPRVASDAAGNFVVAWNSNQDGYGWGIAGRRFDASGAPRGPEFAVNTYTTGYQQIPWVASDPVGNFTVTWNSSDATDEVAVVGQRFGGLVPAALAVDASASSGSDGNGVLEPGETTAAVAPSWRNVNGATQTFGGNGLGFSGPSASGVSYLLTDGTGSYGTVANAATAACSDCYEVGVGFGGTRPSTHWDATFTERITPDVMGQTKQWTLHVGESFTDVPKTSGFYRFVETVLHKGITSGCSATTYCPTDPVTREQMAVFTLVGKEGSTYLPTSCTTPVFGDVPASSPFCRFVEELARRGVVSGCGGGNFCPTDAVTREQMSVFLLHTLDPLLSPPACATPMFPDVPASSPFCRWVEELARRGITSGCGGGNYCPASAVTREQMAVFISATFGLTLYGP